MSGVALPGGQHTRRPRRRKPTFSSWCGHRKGRVSQGVSPQKENETRSSARRPKRACKILEVLHPCCSGGSGSATAVLPGLSTSCTTLEFWAHLMGASRGKC